MYFWSTSANEEGRPNKTKIKFIDLGACLVPNWGSPGSGTESNWWIDNLTIHGLTINYTIDHSYVFYWANSYTNSFQESESKECNMSTLNLYPWYKRNKKTRPTNQASRMMRDAECKKRTENLGYTIFKSDLIENLDLVENLENSDFVSKGGLGLHLLTRI